MTNGIFDTQQFIKGIVNRETSLLAEDIMQNSALLQERINGKNILVIGGAGTIGGSFVKAILRNGTPRQMILVDINENGLTEIIRDIRSTSELNVPATLLTYPVNFSDPVFLKILRKYGPFDVVANFAAHKHVRSEKDEFSIEAMMQNNVIKAKHLLDQLAVVPPEHFFCVSTDKAANPVNIMGASKKIMEDVIMAYAEKINIKTARFANVAFSNGSLPFGFMERLAKKQPLSAPLDIKRFFVSPDESGEICMMACLLGESGDIFFPKLDAGKDMQTFTFIGDQLLRSMGLVPFYCESEEQARQMAKALRPSTPTYPVYYFASDTSGEKPYEEFYTASENITWDAFAKLGIIKDTPRKSFLSINKLCDDLDAFFNREDVNKKAIVSLLKEYLPDFEHIEKGKSLDQRM